MSPDVAELVGDWADQVDNRSLLYEKFALPKKWVGKPDEKLNEAGRWSLLRIVRRGGDLLQKDASRLDRESRGESVTPSVRDRKQRDADVASNMGRIARADSELIRAVNQNAARFLADLRTTYGDNVITFEATLASRLILNLAGGVVENAGISLDRCFGLPLIPGSAVKGITRSQALWEIRNANPEDRTRLLKVALLLFGFSANDIKPKGDFAWAGGPGDAAAVAMEFGNGDLKGCASFLPAYPTNCPEIVLDMVNPHYPEYYGGRRSRADDNESPVPNYFPAVKEGGTFGFAVLINRSVPAGIGLNTGDILDQARRWIDSALSQKGLGAKTAAGYGWFEPCARQTKALVSAPPTSTKSDLSPADAFILKWRSRLNTKDNFPVALPELAAISDDAELRRAFEAVVPENERRRNRRNHPYWQAFTSGKFGDAGRNILARLGFTLT
ncbi:MAG: type III-B CRISPR module RAMP protein Cmr6 [Verrucomicrobiae bacterium]|nr:type III-B CRISPR module RAMP protein Cmr6 [Verrucomicrobiae bacterium]